MLTGPLSQKGLDRVAFVGYPYAMQGRDLHVLRDRQCDLTSASAGITRQGLAWLIRSPLLSECEVQVAARWQGLGG